MQARYEPFYLAGPTGSGKTAVALKLAGRLESATIINADAFQIYKGIEILSAAPSATETARAPHLLFGALDAGEECDAANFARLAETAIAETSMNAVPLLVGGSGLYLKAITHGLAPTPPGNPDLRQKLEALSLEEIVSWYEKLDPEGAAATNLKNRRYVTRNLEICILSGEPASELKSRWERNAPKIKAVYLHRDREDLYERINRRTSLMFEDGVVEEIRSLGKCSDTAEKAIGLREIRQLLAGEIDEETCIEQIRQNTRRYAKRQESWFKREDQFVRIPVESDATPERIVDRILEIHDLPVS